MKISSPSGYDRSFLGSPVEMPRLSDELKSQAAPLLGQPDRVTLDYTHFSLVMNKERRQAFFTASNLDGSQTLRLDEREKWRSDDRMDPGFQLGPAAYRDNDIDRGHLVHGASVTWGPLEEAREGRRQSNTNTNASLQFAGLNQDEWLALEGHIIRRAEDQGLKMSIFSGPVFRPDDPRFDNQGRLARPVQIPREFWKVVVWNDPQQGLQSESYVMSQEEELAGIHGPPKKDSLRTAEAFNPYRVSLDRIEQLTGLEFPRQLHTIDGSQPQPA